MSGFDSLGYAQKLRAVGMPPEQAETEAALIRDEVLAHAATKGDVIDLEERLEVKFERLDGKIDRAEERSNARIDALDQRLTGRIDQLELRMTVRLGGMLVVAVGFVVAAQKLFQG